MIKNFSVFFVTTVISSILYYFIAQVVVRLSPSADNAVLVIAVFGIVIIVLLSFLITIVIYLIDLIKQQN